MYFPGREPAGYWEMLRARKPAPLIARGGRTEAEWIDTGRRVFEEMDVPTFRSTDPQIIAMARSAEEFARLGGRAQKDGRYSGCVGCRRQKVCRSASLTAAVAIRGSCRTARS